MDLQCRGDPSFGLFLQLVFILVALHLNYTTGFLGTSNLHVTHRTTVRISHKSRRNSIHNHCISVESSLVPNSKISSSKKSCCRIDQQNGNNIRDKERRKILSQVVAFSVCSSFAAAVPPALSYVDDDFSSPTSDSITQSITQSDLGMSVRRSVVRGAQFFDKVDAKWEQFSDRFRLGYQRTQVGERPKPTSVQARQSLNSIIANDLLDASDEIFLKLVPSVTHDDLLAKINKLDGVLRKSFVRSGVDLSGKYDMDRRREMAMNGDMFNYYSYLHFKAYCDILIASKASFAYFRTQFENSLGFKILSLLDLTRYGETLITSKSVDLGARLNTSFRCIDTLIEALAKNGFIAEGERSTLTSERIDDWIDGISPCTISIPLDGDVTLQAQILLQEQGFRLYPNYARFAITAALKQIFQNSNQAISSEEYYMDTNYNSDPDLFEAKQNLINIVIESD